VGILPTQFRAFRQNAEKNTQNACAPLSRLPRRSVAKAGVSR
jgi:hypothetical protein